MKLKKAYLRMQKESGFNIGDTVRVLRRADSGEWGWCNNWSDDMDIYVEGADYEITDIDKFGVRLGDDYQFPFFVLELVEKAKVDETLEVGQWFKRKDNGNKYVLTAVNSLYFLSCEDGTCFTLPKRSMEDAFSVYRYNFTRITEPFAVEPK